MAKLTKIFLCVTFKWYHCITLIQVQVTKVYFSKYSDILAHEYCWHIQTLFHYNILLAIWLFSLILWSEVTEEYVSCFCNPCSCNCIGHYEMFDECNKTIFYCPSVIIDSLVWLDGGKVFMCCSRSNGFVVYSFI